MELEKIDLKNKLKWVHVYNTMAYSRQCENAYVRDSRSTRNNVALELRLYVNCLWYRLFDQLHTRIDSWELMVYCDDSLQIILILLHLHGA